MQGCRFNSQQGCQALPIARATAAICRRTPCLRSRQHMAPSNSRHWRPSLCCAAYRADQEEDDEQQGATSTGMGKVEPYVLFETESPINGPIIIKQVPDTGRLGGILDGARLLYMGESEKLLSVYKPLGAENPLTYAYWDFFAAFPMLLDEGPLAIYGWGGGTAARLILEVYEEPVTMHAWELDEMVVEACKNGFGQDELLATGHIKLHKGDALADTAVLPGGFAGIIVDLFVEGVLHPALLESDTWRQIRSRLSDPMNGYVMVHVGPGADEYGDLVGETIIALNAMWEAWDGQLLYIDPPDGSGLDSMALAGPPVDNADWAARLGPALAPFAIDWEPWEAVGIEIGEEEGGEEGEWHEDDDGNVIDTTAVERPQ